MDFDTKPNSVQDLCDAALCKAGWKDDTQGGGTLDTF